MLPPAQVDRLGQQVQGPANFGVVLLRGIVEVSSSCEVLQQMLSTYSRDGAQQESMQESAKARLPWCDAVAGRKGH